MAHQEPTFDLHQLTHEVGSATQEGVTVPFRLRTYRLIRKILIGFILVSIANVLFSYFFLTPKMLRINRDNQELVVRYRILQDRIRTAERRLDEIRHRDLYVYRPLFAADTVSVEGVGLPYPDAKYAALAGYEYSPLMTGTWRRLDGLARRLYETSLSLDELQQLSRNKEIMSQAIPAIWPIDRTKLRNGIGAFGMRRHPIYSSYIMHKGVDLACDIGNPVYATGDGVVERTDLGLPRKGYGKQILLDHEFGYKTRYAHLSRILVKPGERVVRGQKIAEVGNTGGTTGPHLHYEVILRGQVVNPINYFNKDMTPAEYTRLMEEMHETNLETY